MDEVNPYAVFEKLDRFCFQALNDAVAAAIARRHYKVDVEHWLLKLMDTPDAILQSVTNHFDVDLAQAVADITQRLNQFRAGNDKEGPPPFSPHIMTLIQRAWGLASLKYSDLHIRSGYVLCALLMDDMLAPYAREISNEFKRIDAHTLSRELPRLTALETKASEPANKDQTSDTTGGRPAGEIAQQALDQYTIDLTQRAQAGEIDPVIGRDREIRQLIDILTRRRQNNPILTGEAGVGKTAVVEGFARCVVAGDVPPSLQHISVRTLDLGLLQAGAGVRGEFENRLKSVIDEVKAAPQPVVLFIDEAHTLIGAGGASGQNDAANLLKPALARGELRTIAATTWAEYKKYFERDAALARRFEVVKVEEPTETEAVEMIRGLVQTLAHHHNVRIRNEAVVEAVRLSSRYISGRQLPDKAISLLDTACARAALSQSATPPKIADRRQRIDQISVELSLLQAEAVTTEGYDEHIAAQQQIKQQLEEEVLTLEERWAEEKSLIEEISTLRKQIEQEHRDNSSDKLDVGKAAPDSIQPFRKADLTELELRLEELQGETPLVYPEVNAQTVAEVVATWTGIPVGRMATDEIHAVLHLKEALQKRVIGQDHALDVIAQTMRMSRAKLTDPRKPIGVFLLVGPSGVGKTETALALAEQLYGGEDNITVINMSEFKEEHKVATLMGAPPGYVGYGEGGVLTEAVRRQPYSVILLDEMEKAHPGIQDVFYQVFDKGLMRDGEGRDIDFKNTVIFMTSNAAAEDVVRLCREPDIVRDDARLVEALQPHLLRTFKPAFLGRVTLVPYLPLEDEILQQIVELNLQRVKRRVEQNYRATLTYAPEVVAQIMARCQETETGARVIEHILNRTMLPELATHFLAAMMEDKAFTEVRILLDSSGALTYALSEQSERA